MATVAEKIIFALAAGRAVNQKILDDTVRRILRASKAGKIMPAKSELLKSYHKLRVSGKIAKNVTMEKLLVKRSVRTLSGVAIVTVLTKSYPCPGKCVYCPSEARMPKSYLSDEPAAARALALKFSPFNQVAARLSTLKENGHPTDKVELIIKGGTWNAYPLAYQNWFIKECLRAGNHPRGRAQKEPKRVLPEKILRALKQEQTDNERAERRIIGVTLETRPDWVTKDTVEQMRVQGCTRIELGVQTTDDRILKIVKRGHGAAAVKTATQLLKRRGFKVDYHLMPQLPLSTPQTDGHMLSEIFSDPDYRPDMVKIYPCTVIKNSELYQWLKSGRYRAYSDRALLEMLIKFKTRVPRYVRISRLIRDIPSHHIQAGNRTTNLRQVIKAEMDRRGLRCNCLRCREAGHRRQPAKKIKIKLFTDKYRASGGTEYFLSFEDSGRRTVFAFCRLRLDQNGLYPAFIRELHTYGQMVEISRRAKNASQHTGLGKKLMAAAEKICRREKIGRLAVIAGVGVRPYYRKLGYRLENGYMVKNPSGV